MHKQQQKTPYLFFLLEYKKFTQIIKAMINETIAKKLLCECGYEVDSISKLQDYKINTYISRFSIRQLIFLKGSTRERPREYENKYLLDLISRKLKSQSPDEHTRKVFWVQFTQIYQKPKFYEDLNNFQLPKEFEIAIQKDIKRTYKSPQIKSRTSQVLAKIAIYNPFIGYCQGMNTIIAYLLQNNFTDEQAFFIFKLISETILPSNYYNTMDCAMAYMRIFYELLSITHPNCYIKMKKISEQMGGSYMPMVSFVFQWFVCLFCNDNVWKQITGVVWDFFLVEGVGALFKAGLAMFDFLQPYIAKCSSYQQYVEIQRKNIKQIKDHMYFKNKMIKTYISPTILMILKQKLLQLNEGQASNKEKDKEKSDPVQAQKNKQTLKSKQQIQKKDKEKLSKLKCNRKWNSCSHLAQQNLKKNFNYDYFVFKTSDPIVPLDNYLGKLDKLFFNNDKKSNIQHNLLIGRMEHICPYEEDQLSQDSGSSTNNDSNNKKKKITDSILDPNSPIRVNQNLIRRKAAGKIEELMKKQKGMQRSESMEFMLKMVQNVSFSNLLQIYQIDSMFQS